MKAILIKMFWQFRQQKFYLLHGWKSDMMAWRLGLHRTDEKNSKLLSSSCMHVDTQRIFSLCSRSFLSARGIPKNMPKMLLLCHIKMGERASAQSNIIFNREKFVFKRTWNIFGTKMTEKKDNNTQSIIKTFCLWRRHGHEYHVGSLLFFTSFIDPNRLHGRRKKKS